jgi:cytochrome o ubiquinol oxidase subunit 2
MRFLQRIAQTARKICPGSLLVLLTLAGCHAAVIAPTGPIGVADRIILPDVPVIMLAVVVPTILVTLAFAWWFRASNTRARFICPPEEVMIVKVLYLLGALCFVAGTILSMLRR